MTEPSSPSPLRLTVRNYRGVREAAWSPEGVCALVGPNASGKSTLLEVFLFLHFAARLTPRDAVQVTGGVQTFLHLDPVLDDRSSDPALASVVLAAATPDASWSLQFASTNDNIASTFEEVIVADGVTDGVRPPSSLRATPHLASPLWSAKGLAEGARQVATLRQRLLDVSLYRPWELQHFRKQPWSDPTLDDLVLSPDGANLFVVLQNWQASRAERWRFEWVVEKLQRVHHASVAAIELTKGGGALSAQLYGPGTETPLPIRAASNGVLATLLTLTAVAGAREGGIVLLDEPDNGLHPFAIRSLVDAFRELHDNRGTTVVLATHSPVILNAFNECPEDVWVTERRHDVPTPRRLTEIRDEEWLANFRLGSLYGVGFGRQDPMSGDANSDTGAWSTG